VFLQRGQLDTAALRGLTRSKWGDTVVEVSDGWPRAMVWQGGRTVITAVGESDPAQLRTILSSLPRQSGRGTLDSLHHNMSSMFGWFTN
jgi:hypothetical protein